MNLKSEKGYTGVEIVTAIIILFIFVSVIATVHYQFSSSVNELNLKSKAIDLAIDKIEQMKIEDFSNIENRSIANGNSDLETRYEVEDGFFRTIVIQDYADEKPNKFSGIVKKVTVKIQYIYKGNFESVELSSILSKEY